MGTFVYKGPQMESVPLKPKVFIIGTHKDLLNPSTAQSEITKIDQHLQAVIRSTSHYQEDLVEFASESQLIFTVNNLSKDDLDFQKIRSAVECVVCRSQFQISFPSHWLIFSLVLRQEMIKESVISYEQCSEIAKDCEIDDPEELDHALWFLHTKLGLIRHFPTSGLRNIVIRHPQILFDMVTKLIVNTFTFENVSKFSSSEFVKKGIFSLEDFIRVEQGSASSLLSPNKLLELLEHLRIVAPFEEKKLRKFFIPCVLSHSKESQCQTFSQTSNVVPPLLINFECGYCPKGLSGALIVYLLTNEMGSKFKWELMTDQIFRDQVTFGVSPYDIITLKIHLKYLEIIHSCTSESERTQTLEDVCNKVCAYIEKGIRKVSSDMNLTSQAKHSLSFYCQNTKCYLQEAHPATKVARDEDGSLCNLWCKFSGNTLQSPLPEGYCVWFGTACKSKLTEIAEVPHEKCPEQPLYTDEYKASILQHHKPKPCSDPHLNVKFFKDKVKIIIPASNTNEKLAIYEKLKTPKVEGCETQLERALYIPQQDIVIGTFAGYTVGVLTTEQGSNANIPLKKALDMFPNAQAVMSVGIGYGKDRESIKFADVMVSDHIENALQVAIKPGATPMQLKVETQGARLPIKNEILRYFKNNATDWEIENDFKVSEGGRQSRVKVGTIVSCETLFRAATLKEEYMALMANTVGGEMQGSSLLRMVEWMEQSGRQLSVIVIKGVANYGDNQEDTAEMWQFTAAKAAVDFVHYCLEQTNGQGEFLPGIHHTHH